MFNLVFPAYLNGLIEIKVTCYRFSKNDLWLEPVVTVIRTYLPDDLPY